MKYEAYEIYEDMEIEIQTPDNRAYTLRWTPDQGLLLVPAEAYDIKTRSNPVVQVDDRVLVAGRQGTVQKKTSNGKTYSYEVHLDDGGVCHVIDNRSVWDALDDAQVAEAHARRTHRGKREDS